MRSSTLVATMAALTILLLGLVTETDSSPGHLVHDFYKCESEYFKAFFKRCKRNLPHQRNSAPDTHSSTSMLVIMLSVGLSLVFSRT
jgi:hypothetical protein